MKNKQKKKTADTQPSDSQLTSSDKLSALPSHIHSSPTGRAVGTGTRRNKSNSGSPEGASLDPLPSSTTITQEARITQTSTLPRRAPPISYSLSDSAAEYSTLPRQRISFDSERESSTSPRPGEFLNAYICTFPSHVLLVNGANAQLNNLQLIVRYPHPASRSFLAPTGPPLVRSWPVPTKARTSVYVASLPTNTDQDIRALPLMGAGTAQTHIQALVHAQGPRNALLLLRVESRLCVTSSVVSLL